MTRGQDLGRQREVWFRRTGWNYLPVHWKGWLAVAFTVAIAMSPVLLVGTPLAGITLVRVLAGAVVFGAFMWLFWLTDRHCGPGS